MKKFKYSDLVKCPPKLKVQPGAREIIFTAVSCMCDNVRYLTLKKNSDGDFKLSGNGCRLSDFQFEHPAHEIEWAADEGKWIFVFRMLNSGTSAIAELKSR